MAAVFRMKRLEVTDEPAPDGRTRILKAEELALLREADAIVAEAKARAQALDEAAQKAYRERYDAGYAEGLEAGRLENSMKMMETVLASVEFIENIESTVVSVVSQAVRKVVGEMDHDDRIRRIVGTALANVRGEQRVTVRVSPADEAVVNEALARMNTGAVLNVVADARLGADSCILESDLGVVDASLATQLKALETAFGAKIKS